MKTQAVVFLCVIGLQCAVNGAPNVPLPFGAQTPFDFTGYQLISVRANTSTDVEKINNFREKYQLDMWDDNPRGDRVLLMTSPHKVAEASKSLADAGLDPRTEHKNVQSLLNEERGNSSQYVGATGDDSFVFDKYMTYAEIVRGINNYYGAKFPHAEPIKMNGKSYYGVDIVGLKLTVNKEKHSRLLDRYEFHIYPSVNPDGYSYTQVFRFWRKSMRPNGKGCVGTDINRNFDVGPFCGVGTSKDSCSEIFCGSAPFSESESQAIRDTVMPLKDRISFYISFHSFGLMWMFPYSYKNELSADHQELLRKAKLGANAITEFSGTVYRVGTIASTIYRVTGSTIDWTYEKAGIKNSYILELQPPQGTTSGSILKPSKIVPTCQETLVGIQTMLLA